jgi:hypothetical protein
MLRGETEAKQIQLQIEYNPAPPFHAGTPQLAGAEIEHAVRQRDFRKCAVPLSKSQKPALLTMSKATPDLCGNLVADDFEEFLKGFDRSLAADPEQTRDSQVDLIDQRLIVVSLGVLDFIHADGVDLAEDTVFQPEGDNVFDGVKNLFP